MRLTIVALLLMVSAPLSIAQSTGTVCVAARVDDPFWKEPRTLPDGQLNTHGLRLRVDKQPSIPWPDRESLKIEDLSTNEWHVFGILEHGKLIGSVRFKFAEYKSTDLCMFYDGYQGIGLQDVSRHTPWCKCR